MYRLWIITISTLLMYSNTAFADSRPLSLGIFPYASTSKLIIHHKNILKHLNNADKTNISFVTAKNVSTYITNLESYKYDLIYSAPHVARFAEKKYGYQRVVMTSHHIQGVILVKKDSAIKTLSDLKNKTISIAPKKTILHQVTLKQLRDNNIFPDKNIYLKNVNTHNNAIYDVIKDDSDAAVTGIKLWKKLNHKYKIKLRQLSLTEPISGFIILAKPTLDKSLVKELQKNFLSFNNTLAGKTYIFKGFKNITDKEMESLDAHARVFE